MTVRRDLAAGQGESGIALEVVGEGDVTAGGEEGGEGFADRWPITRASGPAGLSAWRAGILLN